MTDEPSKCDCSPNYCCCSDADREFAANMNKTPSTSPIKVWSRTFDSEGYAEMIDDVGRILVDFGDVKHWIPREDLEEYMSPEEKLLIQNFVDLKLSTVYKLDQAEGILDVAKQVKLVVGEGNDKIEIGTAEVEKLPGGDTMVYLSITNAALIKALGGGQIKGLMGIPTTDKEDESND